MSCFFRNFFNFFARLAIEYHAAPDEIFDQKKLPFYRRELLCKTVQNRRYDGAVPPASDGVPPSQFNA